MDLSALAAPWIEIGRRLDQHGILAGTEGNFSQRLPEGRVLITARGAFKGRLSAADFALLGPAGERVQGGEPSSEWRLHVAVYAAHDAAAVIHAHPPHATALAATGTRLPAEFLPELLVEFGSISFIPYATPGSEELAHSVEWHYRQGNGALLERHGAITLGADPWQACARMEVLERAARIYTLACALKGGAVGTLSSEQVRALLQAAGGP